MRFFKLEDLIVLIFVLCLYGEAFPYGVPLIAPIIVAGVIWFGVFKNKLEVRLNTGVALFLLSFLFYLVGVIRTSYLYDTNSRDIRNGAAILLFSLLLFSLEDLQQFERFRDKAIVAGVVASTVLAVIGLYKFHLIAIGKEIRIIGVQGYQYPWGTSLTVDYNFYAFAMLCGAISSLYLLHRSSSFAVKIVCITAFCANTLSLSLSGSRRGWVTEMLLLCVVLLLIIKRLGTVVLRSGSRPTPKQALLAVIVIACIAGVSPKLVTESRSELLETSTGTLQSGAKTLETRFETLRQPDRSFDSRITRWKFAAQMLDEGAIYDVLFGQGFDYLRLFATYFAPVTKDATSSQMAEDYPHNPLLSAALYSGVLGSVVVIAFLILVLIQYFRQRSVDSYFQVLYFASLWFILPAYDSLFSGKFFGIMLLIPWAVPSRKIKDSYRQATSVGK